MRDYRSSLLILLSVLLLISAGLFFTALYHFYYKTPLQVPIVKQEKKHNPAGMVDTHDSLMKIYTAAVKDLDKGFDANWNNTDSLKESLDTRLNEFYQLRNEIKAILSDRTANADIELTGKKIAELRERIAALRNINEDVERENKRLNTLLNQLTGEEQVTRPMASKVTVEDKTLVKNSFGTEVFLLSELRFSAIQISNNRDEETSKADQTEKLSGSFRVRNQHIQNNNAEIMVVVVQPDGKVLQNSPWDAGIFETPEGKKVYSTKLRFEYNPGETKQLLFSLTADQFQQGNYMLNIYQNGRLIGKLIKTLS